MNYVKVRVFPLKKFLSHYLMNEYRFQNPTIGALVEPILIPEYRNHGPSQSGGSLTRRYLQGLYTYEAGISDPIYHHFSLNLSRIVPIGIIRIYSGS
jgi:hypothetical protein